MRFGNIVPIVNENDSVVVEELRFGDNDFRTRQRQYTWQNDIALPVGALQLLAERREEQVTSNVAFAVTQRTTNSAGAFYQLRADPHTVEADVRYDHSSQFGGRTTGSVAYGYRIDSMWRVTASAGTAFKIPTFNDLYYPGFSNPYLLPEKSRNIEAALYYGDNRQQARAVGLAVEAVAGAHLVHPMDVHVVLQVAPNHRRIDDRSNAALAQVFEIARMRLVSLIPER